jgi:hypothetical protein
LIGPGVYWETGAISLTQEYPICPFLTGIAPEDIEHGPLAQYQCTYDRKDDVFHLVRSLNQRLDPPEDKLRLKGLFETHWAELERVFGAVTDMGMPTNVVKLLKEIDATREVFVRQWESDKSAASVDPIRHAVAEASARIEKSYTNNGIDKRVQLHCCELRDAIRAITASSSRANWHERGDAISESFEKAIRAIRADFDKPV